MVLMTAVKPRAECVIENYFRQHGMPFSYEALPGTKKPDYLIEHGSGKCIVEVKTIEDPRPRLEHSFDPYRPVLRKISAAKKQFGEYKDYPCALALYSESIYGPSDPSILLSAAFGPGFQQAGRDYGKLDPAPSFIDFSTKRNCLSICTI